MRYAFRIEPVSQRIALARTFGCAGVVYNDALEGRRLESAGELVYDGCVAAAFGELTERGPFGVSTRRGFVEPQSAA
ncbi:helix-turn-helix domain-containing protein [Streptomyces sp. 21So2-11]|uniref:helix-turn-helix domain-containing protein n=1 Tax=Streptomyces sp. 21So2-11 TaxID=3144408 RepID=UPI003219428B